ncbi:hypothetical protein TcYC6_0121160 [Trypanosoma cruzi]|nr:hypothetical protein TcYC6_0121160 [Trypanosoma cruzi]
MTGLRLFLENIAKPREDSSLTGHVANLRAPQIPNFETQALLPIVWVRPGSWGTKKGSSFLEGGRSSTDYAHAIADVQNRNAQLNSQVEETHNKLSACESHIAVSSGLLAERERALSGREQQLEATRAQPQEREARVSAKEARRAAWEAETAGREEVSTTRRGPTDGLVTRENTAEDGDTKQLLRKRRLMVGGASSRTAKRTPARERRQVIPQTSQGNFG